MTDSNIINAKEAAVAWGQGEKIEYRRNSSAYPSAQDEWRVLNDDWATFHYELEYRLKPKSHIVNGFSVPLPLPFKEVRERAKSGKPLFIARPDLEVGFYHAKIQQDHEEMEVGPFLLLLASRGLMFESEAGAASNALALLGIDPGTSFVGDKSWNRPERTEADLGESQVIEV